MVRLTDGRFMAGQDLKMLVPQDVFTIEVMWPKGTTVVVRGISVDDQGKVFLHISPDDIEDTMMVAADQVVV